MHTGDPYQTRPSFGAERTRPITITLLAWFLILGAVFFLALKPLTWSQLPLERNLFNITTKSLSGVCGIGLLRMKRWSVVLYFSMFLLNTVLLFIWPIMISGAELASPGVPWCSASQ